MYYINNRQKSVLSLIEKFGCISEKQILHILKSNKQIERDLKELIGQKLMELENGIYKALGAKKVDVELIKCINIICYFNDEIVQCEVGEFPFKLWLYLEGDRCYDVGYIPKGKELLYSTSINRCKSSNAIISILDDKNYINEIKIDKPDVNFCTLNPIKFYKFSN